MLSLRWSPLATVLILCASLVAACHSAAVPIRFAPPDTDRAKLRSDYALTDAERTALTPKSVQQLTQAQVDQLYERLSAGPMPDGPFRGDLFFPRDANRHARLSDVAGPVPPLLSHAAAIQIEDLGRILWKGKVFFRAQGILRNRIDDLAILKPIIENTGSVQKMTFDGQTTWLLFPAKISCGNSRFDPARHSIVIDYARGSEVEGYRPIPDQIAGPEGLNIFDEVRVIRPGFYLGRAYFGSTFGLNFTLLDPSAPNATPSRDVDLDCDAPASGKAM